MGSGSSGTEGALGTEMGIESSIDSSVESCDTSDDVSFDCFEGELSDSDEGDAWTSGTGEIAR